MAALADVSNQLDKAKGKLVEQKDKAAEYAKEATLALTTMGSGVVGGLVDGWFPESNVAGATLPEVWALGTGLFSMTPFSGAARPWASRSAQGTFAYSLGRRAFKWASEQRAARELKEGALPEGGAAAGAIGANKSVIDMGDVQDELARVARQE